MKTTIFSFAAALVTTALVGCSHPTADEEGALRQRYVRELAEREDAGAAYFLMTRDIVRFGDGWCRQEHLPLDDVRGTAWRWMGRDGVIQLDTTVPGKKRLVLRGSVPRGVLLSSPVITVTLDGQILTAPVVHGPFEIDVVVEDAFIRRRWADLVLHTSSVGLVPGDNRELGIMLNDIRWGEDEAH